MRTVNCDENRVCYMSGESSDKMADDPLPDDLYPVSAMKAVSKPRPRKKRSRKVLKGGRKLKRSSPKSTLRQVRRKIKRSAPFKRRRIVKKSKKVVKRRKR